MNKTCLKFSTLILSGLLFVACSDDDEKKVKVDRPDFPEEYSELTIEQNKAQLEDNGLELIQDLTELKNTEGAQASISFSDFLATATFPADEGGRIASNSVIQLIQALANLDKNKASADKVLSGMRLQEAAPGSMQAYFDDLAGIYTYNSGTIAWDHVPGGSQIVFKFPSTSTGTSNNAEFVIYDYKSIQPTYVTTDLPTSLKADLTVDGTKYLQYTFAASYNSKEEPTSVSTALIIGAFKFSLEVKNTTSVVSADYALTYGNKNLIAFGAGAEGNFSSDNIDNDGGMVTYASAYFQLLNIKLAGEIKATQLVSASDAAVDVHEEATAWNNYSTFVVYYADTKKKIADIEFYGFEDTQTETYCYDVDSDGDGIADSQQCYDNVYYDEYVDVRLVFADGTKSDLETYTSVGFSEIETELDAFMEDL